MNPRKRITLGFLAGVATAVAALIKVQADNK